MVLSFPVVVVAVVAVVVVSVVTTVAQASRPGGLAGEGN